MGQTFPDPIDDISEMYRTNYMGFASFTLLVWDHIDTFADEVEFIWKGRKGPMVYLFLLNRYLTPLGFMVNLYAYLSPVWTPELCSRFIRYEGSMTMIGISVVALMMFIRINALYHRQYYILGGLFFLFLFQVCMNGWLLTRGEAVRHNPESGVKACTMIFDPSISTLASSSAWLPLLYDTAVLILTLMKTLPSVKNRSTSYVMKRLFQDGLIYYAAIFAVTAVLTIMIIAAPPGLKNITAQLELLLTVAMMSRITLNLKKSVHKVKNTVVKAELPSMFTQHSEYRVNPSLNLKIVAPGFNNGQQFSQTDSLFTDTVYDDTATTLSTGGSGSYSHPFGGNGRNPGPKMITIASPKKSRLSTITQESSDWEKSVSTASAGTTTVKVVGETGSFGSPTSPVARPAPTNTTAIKSMLMDRDAMELQSVGSVGLPTIDETKGPSGSYHAL